MKPLQELLLFNNLIIKKNLTLSFKSVFDDFFFSNSFEWPELKASALKAEGAELCHSGGEYDPLVSFPSGTAFSFFTLKNVSSRIWWCPLGKNVLRTMSSSLKKLQGKATNMLDSPYYG